MPEASQDCDKLAGTLDNLQKSIGPKDLSSKEDQEACKVDLSPTQEMLEETCKACNKAVAKTYKLLWNLLPGNPQTQ